MNAKIYSNNTFIGLSNLAIGDESMGCVFGEMIPTENYSGNIKKVISERHTNDDFDFNNYISLKLNAQLENGYWLYAVGGITIDDLTNLDEFKNEPIRIDIAGLDNVVIEKYFKSKNEELFIQEPWSDITIEQKIAFENEVRKEIGAKKDKKSIFSFFNNNSNYHPLVEYELFALCTDQRNDDVLFRCDNKKNDKQFVVIHLTWKQETELDKYPKFKLYDNFESFKKLRLESDIDDWE
ncbi:hypothetical protein [Tenacibaculum ovolyticum]|uniref:hypothetical protein n=1 Tax=Tenacibaculum ovolyticum TaxID=104270 RepID=UPI001F339436|nr:hypothetical protein [Tenacibaculum ovolyticum]